MRICLLLSACLTVLVVLAGCANEPTRDGPELAKVTGTITLDGEPVEGAHIRFSPEAGGPAAFAVSDRRGRYELRTFDPGDGAVPGKYGISATKEVTEAGMEFDSQAELEAYVKEHGERPPKGETVSVLPEKYSSPGTSELTAEITVAKKNRFDLELKSE
jgi:hypothetical protein